MSNPVVHAFFVGRALAEAIAQQLERALTETVSEVGKFDAEQRDRLREFAEEAIARADREQSTAMQGRTSSPWMNETTPHSSDLQATIDELRAETAQLRAELQRYRSR